MIKKIQLINFQCHINDTYEFIDGLNTIIGGNNCGKSSIIRAIFWVLTNKPLGDWMRPKKANKMLNTAVKLWFDEMIVERYRGDDNKYTINGDIFKELGGDIPKPLRDYVGELKIVLGKHNFYPNFHLPDDTAFMINTSSGVKGSMVNFFTGFTTIESIKKNIQSDIRENKIVTKAKTNSLCIINKELVQYSDLDNIVASYKDIKLKYDSWNKLKKRYDYLYKYYHLTNELKKLYKASNTIKERLDIIDRHCNEYKLGYDKYNKIMSGLEELNTLYKQLKIYKDKLTEVKKQLSELPKLCKECGQPIKHG